MSVRGAAAIALLTACRLGFDDPARDDAGSRDGAVGDDANVIDAPPTDAPADASSTAVVVSFGEQPTATYQGVTQDTYITNDSGEAALNYGGGDDLRTEGDVPDRILIRFELAAIPATATVTSASLTVDIIQANPAATLELHPVLEAWTEGALDGATGVANYTQRTLDDPWTTVGCGMPGSAGATFATATPTALGPLTIAISPAIVQAWVTSPGQNFGFVIYNTSSDDVRLASSEESPASVRPRLTVTYEP